MKYALIGLAVVLGMVAVVAYWFARTRKVMVGGFRDWVKDPEYKEAAEEYFEAMEALTVPEELSDAEIQRMVDRLFVQADKDFNFERLKLVGAKAVPFLIEALGDPAKATKRFGKREHVGDAKTPFERICELLEPTAPAEAVEVLAGYLEHEDGHIREHAALVLGSIGSSQCIEPMLSAFARADEGVWSYAMMGMERGIEAERCEKEFVDAMFPLLVKLVDHDPSTGGMAPKLLLAIDDDRAASVLLSPEHFTIENRRLHRVLKALNQAGCRVPHERLFPYLKAVKPLADRYPHDYGYAEALKAYAYNPDGSAEATLRGELNSANEPVQTAAAEGLAILSGITDAGPVVFDAVEKHGFDGLSQAQQYYYAVFVYDAEVNNGGHAQYFVNSSGAHWRAAIAGLKAVGAVERSKILGEATALFGARGPSEDDEARHKQLAGFSKRVDESLDALDKRYYSCDENVGVLLCLYAIEHKEDFGGTE
jgi:HEAT repeat protein